MDRCAKVFVKAFLSPFSACRPLITLCRHHTHSIQLIPLISCSYLCSMVRCSHNAAAAAAAAAMSYQKLDHRSLVQVCGTDILGFLQGLVTNDVKLLETDDSSVYAMMLNVQACITCVLLFMYIVAPCVIRNIDHSL